MAWSYTPWTVPLLVAAVLAAALALLSWERRSALRTVHLTTFMLGVCFWLLMQILEINTASLPIKLLAIKLQYIPVALLPTLWFAFCMEYGGRVQGLMRRNLALLLLEPAIGLALASTNDIFHSLVWRNMALEMGHSAPVLLTQLGYWGLFHLLYALAMTGIGTARLVRSFIKQKVLFHSQSLLILLGVLIATTGGLLDVFGVRLFGPVQNNPFTLTLAGMLLTLALVRLRLLDIIPLARDAVLDNMSDGVIMLDNQNRIVDLNQAARGIIGNEAPLVGDTIEKVWSAWPGEMTLPLGRVEMVKEVIIKSPDGPRHFDVRISSLLDRHNHLAGRLVVMRDISRQKLAEEALRRRDNVLEAIGFAAEQFLRSTDWEQNIQEVLQRLGDASKVSRVYLSENYIDTAGQLRTSLRHEWTAWGIRPRIVNPQLQNQSLIETGFSRWVEIMGRGKVLYGAVRQFPPSEQEALASQEIKSIIAVPIFIEKRWWGFIGFDDCWAERQWTAVEVDALRAAANAIGAVLQRKRAEEEVRHWADVIRTLLDLSEMIGSTMDVEQVLDRVVLAARSLLPVDRVSIFLKNEKTNTLLPAMPEPDDPTKMHLNDTQLEEFAHLSLPIEQVRLIQELQDRKQAIAITNAETSPLLPDELVQTFNIQSLLAVPIIYQDRFTGVLYLDYTTKAHSFSAQEIDLATALARQAALALDRARLYTQTQQDARELSTLYRASSQLLTLGGNLQSVAQQVALTVTHDFEFAYCEVFERDTEEEVLRLLAQSGALKLESTSLPLKGPGLVAYAASHAEIVYAADVSQDSRYLPASPDIRSELVLPLRVGGEVIGAINLESPDLDAFDESDRRILTAFADDAALALQNVRLFQAAEAHGRQLALLNDITRTAISVSDFSDMLQALADQMSNLINSDDCYINLWNEELQRILPGAASGKMQHAYPEMIFNIGKETITNAVLETGKPVVIEDALQTPHISQRLAQEISLRSALALPLIAGEKKLGSVLFGFQQPHRFTRREISLCDQVAAQVSLAIAEAWSLDLAQRRAQEADNLRQATAAIASSLDLRQVLDNIMVHLEQVVPFDSACVFLLEGISLRAVAGRGLENPEEVIGKVYLVDELFESVQNRATPLILANAQENPFFQNWGNSYYIKGWMGVPLHGRGMTIGLLTLDSRQENAFDERSANLAQAFASQAAVAIENSQLFERSRQRAQEAETLRQAGAIVASTLKQDEAMKLIMEQLERVVPFDSASVQLLRNGYLEIVGGVGWPTPQKVIGMHFPIPGPNPNTQVIESRQPYILGNVGEDFPEFELIKIRSWLGVPLIVRERVVGMLSIDSYQPNRYTPDHARLAVAFADQVAIVMENARLFAAEQERVQQLDALRATAADISAELELGKLLQTILERAVSLLEAAGGELGLYHDDQNTIEIVASYNMGHDFTGVQMRMGEGAMGRTAESLQPLIIQNYSDWSGRSQQYDEGSWHTVMVTPLTVGGRLVGVIGMTASDPLRNFDSSDLQLLTLFAQQAAVAVENARLYQDARQAAERRAILHRVSQEVVSASFDPEQIYGAVHEAASQLMPAEAFVITLVDEAHSEVEAVYLIDRGGRNPNTRMPIDKGLSGRVIASGASIYIEDMEKEVGFDGVHFGEEDYTRSILAVPLRLGDRIIGMLSTQSYKANAYTTEDLYLMEMLAANTAIAIENTRLLKEVQWLAITDPLTGLFNRRGFFELGQREVERFRRFGRPFSAIMMDLDRFKQVNDTYGHAAGDQVLIGLTGRLRSKIRDVDVMGRYGGEEIVIILPETDIQGASLLAERLRSHVEKTPIDTDRGPIPITISLGVAEFKSSIPDLASLLDRADSAMYVAKQSGRNQVRLYTDE
ncbi:MAG TPA: GAF domain-containing protein [Anaerolineales bacterium]|nr:GAF domain-containing protein [Anaerolineales bacterium]